MNSIGIRFQLMALAGLIGSVLVSKSQAQTFTDASQRLNYQDLQLHGAWGASFVDIDANGLPDVYEPGTLYLQQANGNFISSLPQLGIPLTKSAVFGASYADVDDDGFPEMFTIDLSTGNSIFYKNKKGLALVNSTQEAGFVGLLQAQGTVFGDFNGDQKLDMFMGEETGKNQLFLGDGTGQFVESTLQANITTAVRSYGVAAVDFDNDGDLDVFIAACAPIKREESINMFFKNNGDGTFTEIGAAAGVNDDLASWGIVWLDYDRDGFMDTYIVNMVEPDGRTGKNVLYRNNGNGTFTDKAAEARVTGPHLSFSFGTSAADFNNDGWVDLYVSNRQDTPYLFINNGDGTFTNKYNVSNIPLVTNNTSIAAADYNGDGWVDLFSGGDFPSTGPNSTNRGSILMLNDGGTNGFLTVNLIQPAPNKRGIGARIEVWQNGKVQLRDITAGDGFASQNMDFSAHFGLGTASSVDSLIIKWPDRKRDKLTNVQANQHLSIQKGGTINRPPSKFEILQMPMIANAGKAEANFFWEPSIDPEGKVVTYIVTVKNSDGEIVYESPSIETPFLKAEFQIDRASFQYSWVVTATDGLHVRRSLNVSTLLQVTGDAVEDGQLPRRLHVSSLFPNPVSTTTNLLLSKPSPGNLTIEVMDMLGRVVFQNKWANEAAGMDVYRLDLTYLTPGAYAIRVKMGGQVQSKAMVKVQ